jgi:hypothetical protein
MKLISTRVEQSTFDILKKMAEREERKLGDIVRRVLVKALQPKGAK